MMEIRCQRSDVSGQWSVMPAARLLEDFFELLAKNNAVKAIEHGASGVFRLRG